MEKPDIQEARRLDEARDGGLLSGRVVIRASGVMSGAYFGTPQEMMETALQIVPGSSQSDFGYLLPLDALFDDTHFSGIPI